jgi:hypothetical protein
VRTFGMSWILSILGSYAVVYTCRITIGCEYTISFHSFESIEGYRKRYIVAL